MTQYPRDQFDDVPEYRDRKGTHRANAVVVSASSGLLSISVAAALALIVGAFCFLVLPSLLPAGAPTSGAPAGASASESPDSSPARAAESSTALSGAVESPESSAPSEPSEPSETAGSDEEQTEEPESSESPSASEAPAESATPDTGDTSAPVEVYNASSINGLAGQVSGTLSSSGYTVAGTGNWQGFSVPSSGVYYSVNETTAQAVASDLGLPLIYEPRVPGIAVVLNADYAG
ncbi:LytR C-terminal domain-containing protein [Citricoccus sp. GCM10030269]|uniref:LytR C-terminal domain-containing protein n=1 Tax=Citricoccus sp. GCM10030269 TaxID=3273388 RepID=UPI00360F8238